MLAKIRKNNDEAGEKPGFKVGSSEKRVQYRLRAFGLAVESCDTAAYRSGR